MRPFRTAAAICAVCIMLLTCLTVSVPGSSAESSEDYNGMYGATRSISTDAIEAALVATTGKGFQDYVAEFNSTLEPIGYNIDEMVPFLDTKISLRRDVDHDKRDYEAVDRISGYVDLGLDSQVTGRFPAEGTYPAKDGENGIALFARVFGGDDRPDTSTTAYTHMKVTFFYDITLVTHMDFLTGEITDSLLTFRATVHDREHNNFSLSISEDEYGNAESLTVAYEEHNVDTLLYMDFQVKLTAEDLVMGNRDPTWQITPLVVEHVDRSFVSADLADGVWALMLTYIGDGMDIGQLPGIILKILGSGSRMLDVFETIKSLASTEIPDIGFKATFDCEDTVDTNGHTYCKLKSIKDGGPEFRIPWGGYTADFTRIVKLIPDTVIKPETKDIIDLVIEGIGWNDIDVKDISGDKVTQGECKKIQDQVDAAIESSNTTSYKTPTVYVVLSITGIVLTMIALASMLCYRRWRP